MPTQTDETLKRALARMLPERVAYPPMPDSLKTMERLWWLLREASERDGSLSHPVLDTELLSLCREVELGLTTLERLHYAERLAHCVRDQETVQPFYEIVFMTAAASWQQRTEALARVKEIEL